ESVARLKSRLHKLREQREEFRHDSEAIAEINAEAEALEKELRRALSKNGKIRKAGGTLNKDRNSVSNAIKIRFYKEVEAACPPCLAYFQSRIDLAKRMIFLPAASERWKI
ncbi:MAG: hypothetical protein ACOCVG_02070, partial [Verrucomicrobiota bacterium]